MPKAPPVSLVIRAWNEAKQLERLLKAVAEQDYPGDVELVVVDNGSTDDSVKVAKRAGAKVVHLPQAKFSYPKSLNLGIAAASNELVAETVAHALPVNRDWLSSGVRNFQDPKVVGVYSTLIAFPNGSLGERILYSGYGQAKRRGARAIKRAGMGAFGATNIMLRRSVWEQHPFDERYAAGGEDEAWAKWALSQGYKIILDPGFVVYHSHGLSTWNSVRQWLYWYSIKKPQKFRQDHIKRFRSDL